MSESEKNNETEMVTVELPTKITETARALARDAEVTLDELFEVALTGYFQALEFSSVDLDDGVDSAIEWQMDGGGDDASDEEQ